MTLVKSGNQNLTLAGANSFSGGVVLNQGTTYVNSPTALGTGTLVFAGGNIDVQIGGNYLTMTDVNNNPVTIDANFLYNGSNQTNLNLGNGAVSLGTTPGTNRTIYVNSGVLTLGGAIGNGTTANSLTKANGGTPAPRGGQHLHRRDHGRQRHADPFGGEQLCRRDNDHQRERWSPRTPGPWAAAV